MISFDLCFGFFGKGIEYGGGAYRDCGRRRGADYLVSSSKWGCLLVILVE